MTTQQTRLAWALAVVGVLSIASAGGLALALWKRPHWVPLHHVPLLWRLPYQPAELGAEFSPDTAAALDAVRVCTRARYWVRSGYRSPEANKAAGGVSNSVHMEGRAVDLTVPMGQRDALYRCARDAGFTGFGWGNGSVHIDQGPRRWWTYDDAGEPMSGAARHAHLHKAPASFREDLGLD